MRAAFLAHSARCGDALGRQVAGKLQALQTLGWETRLFLEDAARLQDSVQAHATLHNARSLWQHPTDRAYLLDADWCFVEFGGAFDLLHLLPMLAGKKPRIVFTYYGLTPLHLWEASDRARLEEAHRFRGYVWYADHALANSSFGAEELHLHTGYPRERMHTLPCIITPAVDDTAPAELRRKIGAEQAKVLLFVGRMAVNKRPAQVIEAAAQLSSKSQPVHVVYLGPQADIYAVETQRCRKLAQARGMADRTHFLGMVDEQTLWGWYRTADALVLPSLHEGFGMTVVEAMACGLPVVAASAAALPETIGPAGLLFAPDDVQEFVRQLRSLVQSQDSADTVAKPARKIAVVAPRFGVGFAGGAEASLRTMALALLRMGYQVEVFTTCNRHDSRWQNELPSGTCTEDGLTIHRYAIDEYDLEQHVLACERIRETNGVVAAEIEQRFLQHSLHSTAIVSALSKREQEFDAILTGPYLFGLVARVVERFREKVLLAPCFHEEPTARLRVFQETYRHVGGFLFHSEAEQRLATSKLGFQHPNSVVIGTLLPEGQPGDANQGRALCGPQYIVYCGRYCPEKGLPELVEYYSRYQAAHPDRYRLVCMGHGAWRLPRSAGITDLGYVSEDTKRHVLSGAAALVILSRYESLSIVLLEAWLQGIPVIGTNQCEVIAEQIERSQGGIGIQSYAEFHTALDTLWEHPERGQMLGQTGRAFARQHYTQPGTYAAHLEQALLQQRMPLRQLLSAQGKKRAAQFLPEAWNARLEHLLNKLARTSRQPSRRRAQVHVELKEKTARPKERCLLSLRVENRGTVPLLGNGPGASFVWAQCHDQAANPMGMQRRSRLPGIILPGQTQAMVLEMTAPMSPGEYKVALRVGPSKLSRQRGKGDAHIQLHVREDRTGPADALGDTFLEAARAAVQAAHQQRQLPQDYHDVTEGTLAPVKRFLKKKLLHNFRKAYVDVMSRQQSDVNEALVTALCHLLDGYAVLSRKVTELAAWKRKLARRNQRLQQQLADKTREHLLKDEQP